MFKRGSPRHWNALKRGPSSQRTISTWITLSVEIIPPLAVLGGWSPPLARHPTVAWTLHTKLLPTPSSYPRSTESEHPLTKSCRYNSHVLVLLEGFGHLVEQLNKTQEELAELKNLRKKEVEQFRGISEEWIQRENGYKAEIKRLELVLAKESKNGVASVALARHDSLINRSGTKRFQARLKRLSSSQDAGKFSGPP